jgi:FkbM family methyltransferase
MKQVNGIYLPDADTHFEHHLNQSPVFDGGGTYQYEKIQRALDCVPYGRRGLALDVGAHVGLWSRVLAAHFRQVIAFEPVPAHIECFKANTAKYENITLREIALGNYRAPAVPFHAEIENSGNCRVIAARDPEAAFHVPMDMLDSIEWPILDAGHAPEVSFIKLDVEGFELRVIEGGAHLIKRDKPVIVVEQKPGHAERYGMGQTAAVNMLRGWGMVVRWIKAGDYCLAWA